MDENTVREHAQGHANAVVSGDLRRAGSDLTPESQTQARDVMGRLPKSVISAVVETVEIADDTALVTITYTGESGEASVESRWAERDGRPMIIDLRAL